MRFTAICPEEWFRIFWSQTSLEAATKELKARDSNFHHLWIHLYPHSQYP